MGQYYYGVLLDAESKQPVAASYCGKLTESGNDECKSFMGLLHGRKYRVAWAGDYSGTVFSDGVNMYGHIHNRDDDNALPSWTEFFGGHSLAGSRYLLNHTKHEAVDAIEFTEDVNLLALLCCDPMCRCKGGGDYMYREGFLDVSRWHMDVISASAVLPEGFTLIPAEFKDCEHGTRIWEWMTVPNMLMEKNYYSSVGPSACDFTSELLRGDGFFKWALADEEDIRKEFRAWVSKLPNPESIYKAVDKAKRILKTSRKNIESHVTPLRPYPHNPSCEYKCLHIDGAYVALDEESGEYKFSYGPQAFVKDATWYYLCDTKSRRDYRKYYKRMLDV